MNISAIIREESVILFSRPSRSSGAAWWRNEGGVQNPDIFWKKMLSGAYVGKEGCRT